MGTHWYSSYNLNRGLCGLYQNLTHFHCGTLTVPLIMNNGNFVGYLVTENISNSHYKFKNRLNLPVFSNINFN